MDFIEKKIKELNKEFGDEVISSYWWRLIARFSEFLTQALQDHTAEILSKIPPEIDKDQAWNKLCAVSANMEAIDETAKTAYNLARTEIINSIKGHQEDKS